MTNKRQIACYIRLLLVSSLLLSPWQIVSATNAFAEFQVGQYDEALPKLKKLAASGNSRAQFNLGLMTLQGYGQPANTEAGMKLIKQAAAKGWQPAQRFVGQYALDVEQDAKTAFKAMLKSAKQGDKNALFFVAGCYQTGFGTKKNPSQARRYLIKAAKAGIANAEYYWGKQFIDKSNRRSQRLGRTWLRKAAQKGSPAAMLALAEHYDYDYNQQLKWLSKLQSSDTAQSNYLLGNYYLDQQSTGLKKDGLAWLKKAAIKQYPQALYTLSTVYQTGNVTPINDSLAFQTLKASAKLGYPPAQTRLAMLFEKGIGTSADAKSAKFWQQKSKQQNFQTAKLQLMRWLGIGDGHAAITQQFTYRGINKDWHVRNGQLSDSPRMQPLNKTALFSQKLRLVEPTEIDASVLLNTAQPLKNYETPGPLTFPDYPIENQQPTPTEIKKLYGNALLGNRVAQYRLGQYQQQGIGVDKNANAAAQWYFAAAKQNHLPSEYALGVLFLKGEGVKQDLKKASYWLNRSAFKGNVEAQQVLASIYQHGYATKDSSDEIAADTEQALGMYQLASGAGNAQAKYQLAIQLAQIPPSEFSSNYQRSQHHANIKALLEQANQAGVTAAKMPLALYLVDEQADKEQQQWAFEILNHRAYRSIPEVSLAIALMYERGIGTPKNVDRAIDWYRKAAEEYLPAAHFALGSYHHIGKYLDKDRAKALSHLQAAAQAGLPYANYNLAAIQHNQHELSAQYLQQAANDGYARAALLGADKTVLNNTIENGKQAISTYRDLAQKGNEQAQSKLGYLYEHGTFVAANRQKAKNYYHLAARKKDAIAAFQLAHFYQTEKPTPRNVTLAKKWYQQSANQGFVPAMLALGFLEETYYHNYVDAMHWYNLAADQGSPIAHYNLGLMLATGKVQSTDPSQAIHHLSQAAQSNDLPAQYALALQHLQGSQANRQLAFHWMNKAAQRGDQQARRMLGLFYETGTGTAADFVKAGALYRQAASQGDKLAQRHLSRVSMMTGQPSDLVAKEMSRSAIKSADPFVRFQLAKRYLLDDSLAKQGKTLLNQLAKKGYQPAVALSKYVDLKNKRTKQSSSKPTEASTDNPVANQAKLMPFNPHTLLSLKLQPVTISSASTMQRAAITALNNGQYYQAQAILEKIVALHPDYQPASKLLNLFDVDADQYYQRMTIPTDDGG